MSRVAGLACVLNSLKNGFTWRRYDFLLLGVLLFLINIPIFSHTYGYDNDTIYAFQIFYTFYNHFFFHHELIRWLPYGSFGIQSDYWQLISLTPFQYLAGLLGWALRIRDINFLFKFSLLLEQYALLLGTYFSSRTLFKNRITVFFVCLGMIVTGIWLFQINWNFRIYYLLPLALFLILRFVRLKKAYWLWLSGITFTASLIGVPPYFGALHLLLLTFFLFPVILKLKSYGHCLLEHSFKSIFFFSVFILSTCLYLFFAWHMFDYIISYIPGRDLFSLTTPLEVFLTREVHGPEYLLGLFYARCFLLNSSPFIGILPLIFILYSLIRTRNLLFGITAFATLFLICFSLGPVTPVAEITYKFFFPIRFFRYIGCTDGVSRLFLLLLAGFGLDQYLKDRRREEKAASHPRARLYLLACAVGIVMLMLFVNSLNAGGRLYKIQWPRFFYFGLTAAGIGSLFLLRKKTGAAGIIALLFFAIEILFFRHLFNASWRFKETWIKSEALYVAHTSYQEKRTDQANLSSRMAEAQKIAALNPRALLPKEYYAFLSLDPCLPIKHGGFHWNRNVAYLIQSYFMIFYTAQNEKEFLASGKATSWGCVFGCIPPKLRLVSDVTFVERELLDPSDIASYEKELEQKVIIENVPRRIQAPWQDSDRETGFLRVKHFSFNELVVEADVRNPGGAWLYYADAYHPGWKARVDGRPTPIYRANIGFKAVFLEKGPHTVRFRYWDGLQSLAGCLLAVFGILFAGTLLWIIISKAMPRCGTSRATRKDIKEAE